MSDPNESWMPGTPTGPNVSWMPQPEPKDSAPEQAGFNWMRPTKFPRMSRVAVLARIYRRAAEALETGSFVGEKCCGMPVNGLGECDYRPYHPTTACPNPGGYPESYDAEGNLIP